MSNRFEKHTPVMELDEITSAEELALAQLVALANSPAGSFIRKESGSFVNSTLSETMAFSGLSDVVFTGAAFGDIIYFNGTNWVNLAPGNIGTILTSQGVGIAPTWTSTGVGSVTSVSVVTANGVSGVVATATTTPAITLTLGDITPSSVVSTGVVRPSANDGAALGVSGTAWADLFLASGAVINFNAGAATLTHALNLLTLGGSGAVTLALGTNSITMTGSLGATGARLTKGWFTDLEVTNAIVGSITGNAVTITAANEGTDTSCFPLFVTATTGDLGPKTNAAFTFNSNTGALASTLFAADTITANTAAVPDANDGASLGTAALGWADIFLAAGANILVNNANAKRTIVLSAGGGQPTTTIGCGGPTRIEAGTNDVDYFALEFDTTTEERAFWSIQMPDNYDGSTITAQFVWTNAAGLAAETVVFGIKARAYADDAAIDQAFGTEVTVTDTFLAQGDVHISAESAAVTIGGSPAAGQFVVFNAGRKTGSDNLTGDARLLSVRIKYGINAYSD